MFNLPSLLTKSRALTIGALLTLASTSAAHITLLSPNGGENLAPDSVITVRWKIDISHNLQNWDIWYSTTGNGGPFIPIAMNLAPGSNAVGSIHTFSWTVPGTPSNQVRVRVRMDNNGTNYFDNSNGNLSIESMSVTSSQISLAAGGSQTMDINAGPTHAGRLYFVLGSATGTAPGLSSNGVTLPLNYDAYMQLTINKPNKFIVGSLGTLDASGGSSASFNVTPGVDPTLAGLVLNHAYIVIDTLGSGLTEFASNPQSVTLIP